MSLTLYATDPLQDKLYWSTNAHKLHKFIWIMLCMLIIITARTGKNMTYLDVYMPYQVQFFPESAKIRKTEHKGIIVHLFSFLSFKQMTISNLHCLWKNNFFCEIKNSLYNIIGLRRKFKNDSSRMLKSYCILKYFRNRMQSSIIMQQMCYFITMQCPQCCMEQSTSPKIHIEKIISEFLSLHFLFLLRRRIYSWLHFECT